MRLTFTSYFPSPQEEPRRVSVWAPQGRGAKDYRRTQEGRAVYSLGNKLFPETILLVPYLKRAWNHNLMMFSQMWSSDEHALNLQGAQAHLLSFLLQAWVGQGL